MHFLLWCIYFLIKIFLLDLSFKAKRIKKIRYSNLHFNVLIFWDKNHFLKRDYHRTLNKKSKWTWTKASSGVRIHLVPCSSRATTRANLSSDQVYQFVWPFSERSTAFYPFSWPSPRSSVPSSCSARLSNTSSWESKSHKIFFLPLLTLTQGIYCFLYLSLLSSQWIMILSMIGNVGVTFPLIWKRQEYPTNFYLMGAFVRSHFIKSSL